MPKTTFDAIDRMHLPVADQVIKRWDISGPRYTSYPTADRFVEAVEGDDLLRALQVQRQAGGAARGLSIYVHVPFCESLCYYCACNKVITKHKDQSVRYLQQLGLEVAMVAQALGPSRARVVQLHLGGGSPTFLTDPQLAQTLNLLRTHFDLDHLKECCIEVDPRTVSTARLAHLHELGFNRLSFGVQDFDEDVQKAVHRVQPVAQVAQLMDAARALKFTSINMDLIYGLPLQTLQTMHKTFTQVIALRPDRIALYAYAHLPQRFKPQRRIDTDQLPGASDKSAMLQLALRLLGQAGYVYVGMDHFALPEDGLVVAKNQGRLHRNFQGYSTMPDCDLIGFGVSAISKVGAIYCQNHKTLDDYYNSVQHGRLPVERGLALTRDDLVRRAVIMGLMCQGVVSYESINLAHQIDFNNYFAAELIGLQEMADDGLVRLSSDSIEVTDAGWYLVRAVAMVFDRYLRADRDRARYSRVM